MTEWLIIVGMYTLHPMNFSKKHKSTSELKF